ncbi:MAG: hypothetical protein IE884_08515 [Sulfuricurvum sp.]|nr:hypothetical protein [Sulfuricurvum sp.]
MSGEEGEFGLNKELFTPDPPKPAHHHYLHQIGSALFFSFDAVDQDGHFDIVVGDTVGDHLLYLGVV